MGTPSFSRRRWQGKDLVMVIRLLLPSRRGKAREGCGHGHLALVVWTTERPPRNAGGTCWGYRARAARLSRRSTRLCLAIVAPRSCGSCTRPAREQQRQTLPEYLQIASLVVSTLGHGKGHPFLLNKERAREGSSPKQESCPSDWEGSPSESLAMAILFCS